jgi:hypothetical protein
VSDFTGGNFRGSNFYDVDLRDARFRMVDLSGAELRSVDLSGAIMHGVDLVNVHISGDIDGLTINGVDVEPLINAELNRRFPLRAKMRPTDPAGFLEAWKILEELWEETTSHARRLPSDSLHQSVKDEWSFIETLRHLVFATDSWLRRAILGDPSPWHELGLPWDDMPDIPGVPRNRDARPSLDTVLALRQDRMASVRVFLESLTEAVLESDTVPVDAPGWPQPRSYPVQQCLHIILNEEWEHRLYAERDLNLLDVDTASDVEK